PPLLPGEVSPLVSPAVGGKARKGWSVSASGDGGVVGSISRDGSLVVGDHEGAVVVFQLLMQRWELRPWVVVPRTLVATKEQLALMDEDHSRVSSTIGGGVRRSFGGLAGARSEGVAALAGADGDGGSSGAGEMTCVDSVDLADVVDVRQEDSAPEQA
ncbi:unnamed protein product, partial [Hapterophycus canaliculatus]